jgi:hypothetical protein
MNIGSIFHTKTVTGISPAHDRTIISGLCSGSASAQQRNEVEQITAKYEKWQTAPRETENPVYTIQGRTFIVTPVHPKEKGEKISGILLKLMCGDEDENIKKR